MKFAFAVLFLLGFGFLTGCNSKPDEQPTVIKAAPNERVPLEKPQPKKP